MVKVQRIKCGNGNCYIIEEKGNAVLVDTARPKYRDKVLLACHKVNIRLIFVGDALMNMFYPTVSMLYHNYEQMLESARKISGLGERIIYFGHGRPKKNRIWVK